MNEKVIGKLGVHRDGFSGWARRLTHRLKSARLDRTQAKEWSDVADSTALPSAEERQSQLITFYLQYESLIEILCDAAQYGPTDALEIQYASSRSWMLVNYIEIRQYVTAYLEFKVDDVTPQVGDRPGAVDAFEALFYWPTLRDFLRADDGHMIHRIMRTRDALTQYGEHLRQLVAS